MLAGNAWSMSVSVVDEAGDGRSIILAQSSKGSFNKAAGVPPRLVFNRSAGSAQSRTQVVKPGATVMRPRQSLKRTFDKAAGVPPRTVFNKAAGTTQMKPAATLPKSGNANQEKALKDTLKNSTTPNLGLYSGPKMPGPDGTAIKIITGRQAMDKLSSGLKANTQIPSSGKSTLPSLKVTKSDLLEERRSHLSRLAPHFKRAAE
jgi:hypothetical protein